ncbi:MAG: DUF1501 domain-containing protein [Acidobacteriota bacterium]
MELEQELRHTWAAYLTRRHFLRRCGMSAIGAALAGFQLGPRAQADGLGTPHFVPRAKRVIYLHMAGAPSQLELFDYKPTLHRLHGQECPESLLAGRRFAFIQGTPKMLGPQASFAQFGESGAWVSDRLPHFAEVVDEVTFLKAMHTDEFNHAPAQLLMLTGSPRPGRPSFGSWVVYGLGSENENLPGFVVLLSGKHQPDAGRAVWSSGFLPTVFEGVQCRSEGDPVLYVSDPEGLPRSLRRRTVEVVNRINQRSFEEVGDPQILSRIAQYEMAFRMQVSVPESMDISQEPPEIHEMYGTEPGKTSFANNCLLARRLIERNVRFVQLFHWGWDSHGADKSEALNLGFKDRCREVDRPMAALIKDLKRRGLLEDTLVVWAGEFGRTPMLENRSGMDNRFIGRDHHSDAFTVWLAGGGVRAGFTHGETDEIGYQGISGRVHVHDLQATVLHLLGMDHERLVHRFQGRDFRLTDVHGRVVEEILA